MFASWFWFLNILIEKYSFVVLITEVIVVYYNSS